MTKICDHTSVGIFVWNGDKLLLIERMKFPPGFAIPAGHVDGDETFEIAAARELKEEVGIDAMDLKIVGEGRKDNQCRRDSGDWHYWKMYKAEFKGELQRSLEETKRAGWYTPAQVRALAEKTERFKAGKITDEDWQKEPGLELVMYEWFRQLGII